MNIQTQGNDYSEIVAADRAHVWHHLSQHKKFRW